MKAIVLRRLTVGNNESLRYGVMEFSILNDCVKYVDTLVSSPDVHGCNIADTSSTVSDLLCVYYLVDVMAGNPVTMISFDVYVKRVIYTSPNEKVWKQISEYVQVWYMPTWTLEELILGYALLRGVYLGNYSVLPMLTEAIITHRWCSSLCIFYG